MTFKHINFSDSSVMRELERKAAKNGTAAITKEVEKIVKNASANKFYIPTGNLFADLIRLAEGLRNKGFVENAESLKEKIFIYKKASEQYNSELSAAHPEGDFIAGEATNGLGDVETLESAHEKIVEIVKKNPTGKQAYIKQQLVSSILKASEEVLEIKKKAQDINEQESSEDIFSGKSATRVATINEINSFLAIQFPKIFSILKSKDLDSTKWVFKYSDLYNGTAEFRSLYSSYIGLDPNALQRFFQQNQQLYGDGFIGDEQSKIVSTLQAYAEGKEINKLISYANLVGGDIGNKYFTGSQPNSSKKEYAAKYPDKTNNQMFRDNPNSIWKWYDANIYTFTYNDFAIDENKLLAAAREIQQVHYNNFQSLFSEEKLNTATAKVQEQLKSIITTWEEVTGFFEKRTELSVDTTSSASLNVAINSQINKLKVYLEDGILFKKLIELSAIMWPGWVPNISAKASDAIKEISNTVNFLNTKPLNIGDIIVTDISAAEKIVLSLGKAFFNAAQSLNSKSQEYATYRKNYNELGRILSVIKNGLGKPYVFIYDKIKNSFPNAITYQKLVEEINVFANEYAELLVKSSNYKNKLIKDAQLVRKSPTSVSSNKPIVNKNIGTNNINRVNLGLAKANMNDPKEVAVATMQQHLAYFAEALSNESVKNKFTNYDPQDIARIIRTGPKANPAVNTYDGKWGSETQAALDIANKYLNQLGITQLDSKARYNNKTTSEDAENVAKNNSTLLSKAIKSLGGHNELVNQNAATELIYDRLPDKINWSEVKYPLMQHRIQVSANDMSSLGSLYDLIIKNNWIEPEYFKDQDGFEIEGISARNWVYIVQWFQHRAQFIYNSSIRTDKANAAMARQYYNAAKRLEGQLQSFFASYGYNSQNETDVVDIESLRQHSKTSTKIKEEHESLIGRNNHYNKIPGKTNDGLQYVGYQHPEIRDGVDWKTPNKEDDSPPIGPDGVINLASRWFHGLDEKLGISHNPLLNPEVFRRYPAADLARTFYANSSGNMDQQARQQALVATGLEVEGYDEAAGDYIVYRYNPVTRRKERTYAMKDPTGAYQRAYKARLMAGPIRSFGALLQSISAALGSAIAEWMRTTQPNDTAKQAEEAWHIEWQRILGLKANEAAEI